MTAAPDPQLFDPHRWEGILAEVARRHHVPGIVAGVLHIDASTDAQQRFVAATGIANLRTGDASDRSTLCQIGSITKLLTSTMIMQLVDEGRLTLETPISEVLPDLRLADVDPSSITIAHLLTHTSGIDGDLFTDTGRGDDSVEKYIATLADAKSLFRPGTGFSYCNSGFVIAGRIIEVLDGTTWDLSLKARICERLGLEHMFTMAEEIMAHRHQYGHIRRPGDRAWFPSPVSQVPRSVGPAGIVSCSADDLLDFGAAFLRAGRTTTGTDLLSAESANLMSRPQHTLIPEAAGTAPRWGLGWMLDDWADTAVQWHGGTTFGNNAWFQVLPEAGLVFVVFCNGGIAPAAAPEVYGAFARAFAGIEAPLAPQPVSGLPPVAIPKDRLGVYADASTTVEVVESDGVFQVRFANTIGPADDGSTPQTMPLHPGPDGRLLSRPDDLSPWTPFALAEVDGREVVYAGIRCLPRVPVAAPTPIGGRSPSPAAAGSITEVAS